jgi:hypothetical protein
MAELSNSRQDLGFVKDFKIESINGGKGQAILKLWSILQFEKVIWCCPHWGV